VESENQIMQAAEGVAKPRENAARRRVQPADFAIRFQGMEEEGLKC